MPFIKRRYFIKKPIKAFLFLIRELNLSQAKAQRFIDKKRLILPNGEILKDKSAFISGDIEVIQFEPYSKNIRPIFKTKEFLVFDKPSGILSHPKNLNTSYSMLDEIRYFGGDSSNPVHRIDKETSGLLLASKDEKSEKFLKNLFQIKKIKKSYLAWVRGEVKGYFEVEEPILIRRDYTSNKHKVEISKYGKYAKTLFKPIYYNKDLNISLIECFPITGRTHQIRVHLFHVKHSIVGDPIYGVSNHIAQKYLDEKLSQEERIKITGSNRLMLHANSLYFKYKNSYKIFSKMDFNYEI
jgi:23S rRNA pseudouridine1911/1915/1917 synthase